jgi:hypothetical protein
MGQLHPTLSSQNCLALEDRMEVYKSFFNNRTFMVKNVGYAIFLHTSESVLLRMRYSILQIMTIIVV